MQIPVIILEFSQNECSYITVSLRKTWTYDDINNFLFVYYLTYNFCVLCLFNIYTNLLIINQRLQ